MCSCGDSPRVMRTAHGAIRHIPRRCAVAALRPAACEVFPANADAAQARGRHSRCKAKPCRVDLPENYMHGWAGCAAARRVSLNDTKGVGRPCCQTVDDDCVGFSRMDGIEVVPRMRFRCAMLKCQRMGAATACRRPSRQADAY